MALLHLTLLSTSTKAVRSGEAPAFKCVFSQSALFSRVITRLAFLLPLLSVVSFGQCTVTRDQTGHLTTTCTGYANRSGFLMNRPDQSQAQTTTVYGGSPYLSFPIYEAGVLDFAATNQKIPCQLAFNLVTNQVLCRFNNDSLEHAILPDAFTVGTRRFVSKTSLKGDRLYYQVLYAGKTKLLAQTRVTLQLTKREPYTLEDQFDGTYIRKERYFIERLNKALQEVTPSKKSVLKALGTASRQHPLTSAKDKLTVQEMIGIVSSYDGF
jgi:hypothetical protein